MNLPRGLSTEAVAWMRTQMTIAASRAVEPLRAELKEATDFADGLFVVVAQVVPHLMAEHPDLAAKIGKHWHEVSARYDALQGGAKPLAGEESAGVMEARKLLYHAIADLNIWPTAQIISITKR